MPKRKIYFVGSGSRFKKARYSKARNVMRRFVRRRRKFRRRRVLSNKQLTKQVRLIKKTMPTGRRYFEAQNQVLTTALWSMPLDTIPPIDNNTIQAPYGREEGSLSCVLNSITIHMTLHVSPNVSSDVNHVYVALIRSSNRDANGNFACPTIGQLFDGSAASINNLLNQTPWRLYREPNSEAITNCTVLKTWERSLCPKQLDGVAAVPGSAPVFPNNNLYSQCYITHCHKTHAKLQFNSQNDDVPIQESGRYYLLGLSDQRSPLEVRLNASVKTTFKSDS